MNTPHPYDLVIGLDRSDKMADLHLMTTAACVTPRLNGRPALPILFSLASRWGMCRLTPLFISAICYVFDKTTLFFKSSDSKSQDESGLLVSSLPLTGPFA